MDQTIVIWREEVEMDRTVTTLVDMTRHIFKTFVWGHSHIETTICYALFPTTILNGSEFHKRHIVAYFLKALEACIHHERTPPYNLGPWHETFPSICISGHDPVFWHPRFYVLVPCASIWSQLCEKMMASTHHPELSNLWLFVPCECTWPVGKYKNRFAWRRHVW